ncbi:ClpP/crotonase [Metschnikowia bicuspidata var. bicuspidata NRRL YB-4993]|uniref:3-hydroxyisobutyryl-CoA hydrolase n=1 Tax=Metschnikowia bicuspidata var. bicuspidata NRRL YB-4993 TaxID=869754 RepID=A0A1A0HEU7_9ASCO|nr:ClpP/crotonase [Metschnikowia bicuspidata var. bicuspidata NRRL YB-4993]OBA22412.1 ClpP/crotonase [Metschnikowia bicuspidata var. bicuspidata NRRL YB-4993]
MASTSGHVADDVLFTNKNMARVITLNRTHKLNSLNTLMVLKIVPRLTEYAKLDVCNSIILTSSSPKALCAGGDVAECALQILQGNPLYAMDFFQQEYNMNFLIATYSKPCVAIMDGVTMGGGVGLSVHAPFRVATENTKLAMPEMDIGFFPDVGTTFFLPRLDDKLGYYYALTGEVLSGADAYMAGFATHYVPAERLSQMTTRISNLNPPVINGSANEASNLRSQKDFFVQMNSVIEEFALTKLPENYKFHLSAEDISLINKSFSQKSFEDVLASFKNSGTEFGLKTYERLAAKSPTCVRVAFELLNRGLENTLQKQLELELITSTNMMNAKPEVNDFVKGVKHKLLDKIKEPSLPEWAAYDASRVQKLTSSSVYTAMLSKPMINNFFGVNFKNYIFNMGLPTNGQIHDYIVGQDGSNRSYLPTPSEVVKHFEAKTHQKLGVADKVKRVLAVHGDSSQYDNKYVTWKDQ